MCGSEMSVGELDVLLVAGDPTMVLLIPKLDDKIGDESAWVGGD